MKRRVGLWQLLGFAITALGGTLLHFLYELTGESVWAAPFSAVNESTWEHMKLLLWPMLLFALVQSLFFKEYDGFWCVKLCGILIGLSLIPVLFYTYNGAVGKSPDWINIAIFFVAAAAAYAWEARKIGQGAAPCNFSRLSFIVLLMLAALFIIFTFKPLHLEIFKDPITGTYGI